MKHVRLKAILVEQGLPQWRLARRLGVPPSTFSDYLRGARPAPADLARRIERELHLKLGTLDP